MLEEYNRGCAEGVGGEGGGHPPPTFLTHAHRQPTAQDYYPHMDFTTDVKLRLECLDRALSLKRTVPERTEDIILTAQVFEEYLKGSRPTA